MRAAALGAAIDAGGPIWRRLPT